MSKINAFELAFQYGNLAGKLVDIELKKKDKYKDTYWLDSVRIVFATEIYIIVKDETEKETLLPWSSINYITL